MAEDFLLKIGGGYNQSTKAEKKVADYILSSPKKVLFMSITKLAEACGVGDTNAFRFCKTTNCKGYQEFKMLLSLSLHKGKQGLGRTENDISLEDLFSQMAEKMLSSNIKTLEETHSLLKGDVLWRAIECFHKVGCICLYGVGTSMTTAMKAADKFLKIEPKVYCASDSHTQAVTASAISSRGVAVISSYSGAAKDTIHMAQPARQAGAAIACATWPIKPPLTTYVDLTLLCGANENPLQIDSSSAEISQLFLIGMLYTECYRTYYDRCNVNNEKTSASAMEEPC